ncbi:hypothetical protein HAX54_032356, partial [Datura stramonium]|nr:hypothetical protein [Datura stramonium]
MRVVSRPMAPFHDMPALRFSTLPRWSRAMLLCWCDKWRFIEAVLYAYMKIIYGVNVKNVNNKREGKVDPGSFK